MLMTPTITANSQSVPLSGWVQLLSAFTQRSVGADILAIGNQDLLPPSSVSPLLFYCIVNGYTPQLQVSSSSFITPKKITMT